MSNLLRYLQCEHDFEHHLKIKKKYSEPKIYDANGDVSKRWYVYFSFRKTPDRILERFPNTLLRCGVFYFVGTSKMLALALRVSFTRAS